MEVLKRGKWDTSCSILNKVWFVLSYSFQPTLSLFPCWQQPLPEQFNTCCCYHHITQQNQAPFCCHLVPFPWRTEIFHFLLLFLLPEQLRSDPQRPRAVTGMKTSIDSQIWNRDRLFQNGFGSGVHTLQLSLGHGKDNENKSYVMLSDVCSCPPYIP